LLAYTASRRFLRRRSDDLQAGDAMRAVRPRFLAALCVAAVSVALVGGCDSVGSSPDSSPTSTSFDSATTDPPPGATETVCGKIRASVSAHMTALGTDIGKYVGYRLADGDDATEDEREAVVTEIKSLASDISRLGATASDASLRSTADRVSQSLDTIADNPDFVSDIGSMSDVPGAVGKLKDAAQPLAAECAQP
jgi:hypothetical protein